MDLKEEELGEKIGKEGSVGKKEKEEKKLGVLIVPRPLWASVRYSIVGGRILGRSEPQVLVQLVSLSYLPSCFPHTTHAPTPDSRCPSYS